VKTALVVGAGDFGRIVAEVLQAQGGWDSVEFIDDVPALWGREVNGILVTGGLDSLRARKRDGVGAVVAVGNPVARLRLVRQLEEMEIPFLSAIHPNATISPSARIGKGVTIEPSVVVCPNAVLGNHVSVMGGALIGHDAVLADGAIVTACVLVGSRVRIGRGAFICSHATIMNHSVIGDGSVVAAGALVGREVLPGTLVYGVPARKVDDVGSDFDWSRLF
jgi:sugar O-acyltransferase (sialic acid O-acetyltransferase NeuD family)